MFSTLILFDGELFEDRNYQVDKWELTKQRLTEKEKQFIEDLLSGVQFYKRKPTNQFKEFRDYAFNKIKEMDVSKPLSALEQIRCKLDMPDVQKFDVMFDEDLTFTEKKKLLKYKEGQYLSQRRILLKKIKALNIK